MEDIRIGRKTNSNERLVAVGTAGYTPAVGPSDSRIALIFSVDSNNSQVWLSTTQSPSGNVGLRISSEFPHAVLTIEEWGDLVRKPWQAVANGAVSLTVFEVFLEDK